jgi:tRNA(Ile)-lysidine synthase TilS/MesJ
MIRFLVGGAAKLNNVIFSKKEKPLELDNNTCEQVNSNILQSYPTIVNNVNYTVTLSKKEYFAGLIMQGLIAKFADERNIDYLAKFSSETAETLLKRLEKDEKP